MLTSFGGEATPAVGFGFGDAVIVELLQDRGLLPDTSSNDIDVLVAPASPLVRGSATSVASDLRAAGLKTDLVLEDKKLKWIFQRADKIKAGKKMHDV